MVSISVKAPGFSDWSGLLDLLRASYAFMEGRIDPPSSLGRFDARMLEEKSQDEILLLAEDRSRLVGCCFLKPAGEAFYIGKLAVDPEHQGRGIGRELIAFAAALARNEGMRTLELQTRIELTENHEAFAAMGFRKLGEVSHLGYDRPTSVKMSLDL